MIPTILTIAFVIVLFLVFWKVLKSILKAAVSVLTLLFIAFVLFGVIVYFDVRDVREAFGEQTTLVVTQDNLMLSSVSIEEFSLRNLRDQRVIESSEGLTIYFDINYLVNDEAVINNEAFSKEELIILLSENNTQSKLLTLNLVSNKLEDKNLSGFIRSLNSEDVKVEPNLRSIMILSRTPSFILNRFD